MHASADNPPSDNVSAGVPPTDGARPIPPRYWWLKRILAATVVLIVGLVALRLWWGWEADRRLQAKIAEFRAAGQPVLIEDFQYPPVPDEENAAYFLMKAAEALNEPNDLAVSIKELSYDPRLVEAFPDDVVRIIDANTEVLRLVREARSRERCDWQLHLTSPLINVAAPMLTPQRELARFLSVATLRQFVDGDHAAAVETLRNRLFVANTLENMQWFLVRHLRAMQCRAYVTYDIEWIAPRLCIDARSQHGECFAPASVDQVKALVDELLDTEAAQQGWLSSMHGERAMQLDAVNLLVDGSVGPGFFGASVRAWAPQRVAIAPTMQLDGANMLEYTEEAIGAGLAFNRPMAWLLQPEYPEFASGIERKSHFVSNWMIPSFERTIVLAFRTRTMQVMAATALEIRLHEIHHGSRPSALVELEFRHDHEPFGPMADPMSADLRPIGYLPSASRPRLYSVGTDARDDEGEYALKDSGYVDQEVLDLVFFLDGDRPRPASDALVDQAASEQAVIDQGEEVGDGGEAEQDQADGD